MSTDRVGTIISTSAQVITEVGWFNILPKGGANQQLQQRHVFTGIPLTASDGLMFTLDMTA